MASTAGRATFLLVLVTSSNSQFYDFFQGFQPFATNQPAFGSAFTTRRPASTYRQTTKQESTTKSYALDLQNNPYLPQFNFERDQDYKKKKNTTVNNYYNTTVKPKKKSTTRRTNNKRTQNLQDYNNNNKDYDGKINAIGDYYTQRPNNRPEYYYTTENPFNKGVKPVITNGPPITNRPVTKRPNYGVNPRPKDEDSISFPDDDGTPEIIIGPDEDYMSDAEKRRYIELAERKCDEYKALGTKAVQAIPLLPRPEPVQISVRKCAPTTVPLVVGGKVVDIQEFPHMALLGWRKIQAAGYSWKCGGSLVSEQFVLTAAHCSFQDRDNTVVNGPPSAVQLGSSYLDDTGALVVRVAAVIRHPKYKLPRSYYDLALVKLVNAVKFSEVVKPACLGTVPAVGKSIIATGWGRTEYGGDQSQELRSVSLPVWEMSRCQEVLGTSRKLPQGPSSESQICAGEERGGKDTCQGDSGGPAQLQEDCIWRVVGVTSLGRSCGAAETPGLYARVQRAFIASQIFGSQKIRNNTINQNYGNDNRNDNSGSNNNYGNNYGNDNRNDNSRTNNNHGNNYGNDNRNDNSGSNNNYGNNNGNNKRNDNSESNNNESYGNNNRNDNNNYGNNNRNDNSGNNYGSINDNWNNNYGGNNKRDSVYTERPNVNYNNRRPQINSQDYNTQRPDRNVVNNDSESQGGNREQDYNSGRRYNQQDYNNYNSQGINSNRPTRYTTTQKPIREDSNVYNYNDEYTSGNNYNARKPVRNNNNYDSSNYNSQNHGSNSRDQTNYNRDDNYEYNNQPQRTQNNYNDKRQSNVENYTVNRPWWLT